MRHPSPFRAIALWVFLLSPHLLSATPEDTAEVKPTGEAAPGYVLAWSDEFAGTSLDTTKWAYRTDSKMWSTQSPANVSVSGGQLHLALKKESAGGKEYTGGGVISRQEFRYGYFEARLKVPPGAGWHTSFWTILKNGPGKAAQELDICEQDSVKPTVYSAGIHDWGGAEQASLARKYVTTPVLAANFHVWGCEFTPETVRFYFDGKLTHETDAAKFVQGAQNIWLTCIAAGLGGAKQVDDSQLPAEAVFDYVRFFRPPAAGQEADGSPSHR